MKILIRKKSKYSLNRLRGGGDKFATGDDRLELLRDGLLHELVSAWDHDVHLARLGRHNLRPDGRLVEVHLASVSFVHGNSGNFTQNLERIKNIFPRQNI